MENFKANKKYSENEIKPLILNKHWTKCAKCLKFPHESNVV